MIRNRVVKSFMLLALVAGISQSNLFAGWPLGDALPQMPWDAQPSEKELTGKGSTQRPKVWDKNKSKYDHNETARKDVNEGKRRKNRRARREKPPKTGKNTMNKARKTANENRD